MEPIAKNPEHAAALADIARHSSALAKIDTRLAEVDLLMLDSEPPAEDSKVNQALEYAQTGVVSLPRTVSVLSEERALLSSQRDALRLAINQKHQALSALQSQLSGQVRASLIGQHRRILKRSLDLLLQLDAIQTEEAEFLRSIEAAGYHASFTESGQWPLIGRLQDMGAAPIFYRVRELQNYVQ